MLEDFLNHKITIEVYTSDRFGLMSLQELTGLKYSSGDDLYTNDNGGVNHRFLHCRETKRGRQVTYSSQSYDVFNGYQDMPSVKLEYFLEYYSKNTEIKEEEYDSLFQEGE